ncbi:MAG TPA: transketolase [Thermoguttaceae bacterium]|nr:transketolase [Thermoguttaceae bacterium]
MSLSSSTVERDAIDTIRTLSMDAVQAANSGHPGTPMALAPIAYVLFNEELRYDPAQPGWPGRDRFVLSCGHASMLLYSMLHLTGVKQLNCDGKPTDEPAVSLEQIRQFRQLNSRCPGHPELGHTSGVEMTTGPLGQGVATSVGMAIASRWLAARYDRPDFELFGFDVYALCSDGDMMEGIGGEAASIAGHLKLGNLCWIYDDNRITIEGETSLAFSEDVAMRFAGYGWQVLLVDDANDLDATRGALAAFRDTADRPTLVICRSHIAWGAPNAQDTAGAHGAPLGEEEVRLAKKAYGWPEDEHFRVPDGVLAHFQQGIGARGSQLREAWEAKFAEYRAEYPKQAAEIDLILSGKLPQGWDADVQRFPADAKGDASRNASGKVLNQVAKRVPWLLGGSADLAPSNKTLLSFDQAGSFSADNPRGRNFHYGIREHAMAAISNGMALCGLRPYAGTFFVFADYLRPSMRLSAMMGLPVLYIFTHDSIGVGEDGPTHQPVEQLAALRAIPNLVVIRPGDANEVGEAYRAIMATSDRPAALVLTRQNLPTLDRSKFAPASGLHQGGYVLADAPDGKPDVILIGTGSETSLCVEAYERLTAEGVKARAVSMPCWELFDAQPSEYRDSVLPPDVTARVAVEAGVEQGWHKYIGCSGRFVGMRGFGASAPFKHLYEHFGITVDNVVAEAKAAIRRE